ncbi:MAG: hypothetical protein N2508_16455 [Anaerolineae bacterium]|nr:hypothetical protein [Anaerolineae bacterium]
MKARLILSLLLAVALVVLVMIGIALARGSQGGSSVTVSASGYTPKAVWALGSYTFTYPVVAHYTISQPATTNVVITVTLDPALQLTCDPGTVLLPGQVICDAQAKKVVWNAVLTYCQPKTLIVYGFATFDQGTLNMGKASVVTVVEWDGQSMNLVTPLFLRKIYLPVVMRKFGP